MFYWKKNDIIRREIFSVYEVVRQNQNKQNKNSWSACKNGFLCVFLWKEIHSIESLTLWVSQNMQSDSRTNIKSKRRNLSNHRQCAWYARLWLFLYIASYSQCRSKMVVDLKTSNSSDSSCTTANILFVLKETVKTTRKLAKIVFLLFRISILQRMIAVEYTGFMRSTSSKAYEAHLFTSPLNIRLGKITRKTARRLELACGKLIPTY